MFLVSFDAKLVYRKSKIIMSIIHVIFKGTVTKEDSRFQFNTYRQIISVCKPAIFREVEKRKREWKVDDREVETFQKMKAEKEKD